MTAPSPPTPAALASELRKLLGEATPGEWSHAPDDEGSSMGWIVAISDGFSHVVADVAGDSAQAYEDAAFIVAAHNLLPAILAERDALRAALEEVAEDVCDQNCPSKWKINEPQPHSEKCKVLRALLNPEPK